jgi:hypothetical protein
VRAPFATRFARLYALGALASAFIAAYRAGLYLFPAGARALSLVVAGLGLASPLLLGRSFRNALLVAPVIALVLSPGLVPSPVTVGPLLFCAGALAGTCAIASVNVRHRRRALRRVLEEGDARSFLGAYFDAGTTAQAAADWRALRHALWAQAWISTPARRARAAARLRQTATTVELHRRVPIPPQLSQLRHLAGACAGSPERIRIALLDAAARLENGRRIFRWRRWLWSLVSPGLDADRDWVAAVDLLARSHRISAPRWFRRYRRTLARAPLTARDVAPQHAFRPTLAKPFAAGIAAIVLATVVLSTATAQTPLDDARALPVMAGSPPPSHVEPQLSHALGVLAGHRAEARCWSPADWRRLSTQRTSWPHRDRRLGPWSAYASPAHDEAHFSSTLCAILSRVVYRRIPVWSDEWPAAIAFSVATLAHEAQHLRGILNEAKAECYGIQAIARTAQLLGRTEAEGRYLAHLYWRDEYHDEDRDPAYVSDECRDGGRLDLNRMSNVWP